MIIFCTVILQKIVGKVRWRSSSENYVEKVSRKNSSEKLIGKTRRKNSSEKFVGNIRPNLRGWPKNDQKWW